MTKPNSNRGFIFNGLCSESCYIIYIIKVVFMFLILLEYSLMLKNLNIKHKVNKTFYPDFTINVLESGNLIGKHHVFGSHLV